MFPCSLFSSAVRFCRFFFITCLGCLLLIGVCVLVCCSSFLSCSLVQVFPLPLVKVDSRLLFLFHPATSPSTATTVLSGPMLRLSVPPHRHPSYSLHPTLLLPRYLLLLRTSRSSHQPPHPLCPPHCLLPRVLLMWLMLDGPHSCLHNNTLLCRCTCRLRQRHSMLLASGSKRIMRTLFIFLLLLLLVRFLSMLDPHLLLISSFNPSLKWWRDKGSLNLPLLRVAFHSRSFLHLTSCTRP